MWWRGDKALHVVERGQGTACGGEGKALHEVERGHGTACGGDIQLGLFSQDHTWDSGISTHTRYKWSIYRIPYKTIDRRTTANLM
jgi:hypothetical protein